jgi:HD-GYP domain-containing protein (c-di-GMP phosphodiesterase class II)
VAKGQTGRFRTGVPEETGRTWLNEQAKARVSLDPAHELLLQEARQRAKRPLGRRELRGEAFAGGAFLAVAVPMAVLLDADRSLAVGPAVLLLAAYALASRIRFEVGAGHTDSSQLLFVPMLFFLPTPAVPLFVAAGNLLAQLPDLLGRTRHPQRGLLALGDSWYAVGPALVLVLGDAQVANLGDWPIYLGALAAQFACDFIASSAREWFELGVPPGAQLADVGWIYAVDALLSPIGLLAALAESDYGYVFLLVLPLVALLAIFASERRAGVESALELNNAYRGATALLADVIEHDDHYTGQHIRDVVSLSTRIADEMELDPPQRRNVEFAALLHDIGKLAISKEIINKRGPLTSQEWSLIKTHTVAGEEMLAKVGGLFDEVAQIVRATHERWDGRGYPDGLRGPEIPLEARIVACCDAWNAMTSDRPYRDALSVEEALAELRVSSGKQFDPVVARTVIRAIESGVVELSLRAPQALRA